MTARERRRRCGGTESELGQQGINHCNADAAAPLPPPVSLVRPTTTPFLPPSFLRVFPSSFRQRRSLPLSLSLAWLVAPSFPRLDSFSPDGRREGAAKWMPSMQTASCVRAIDRIPFLKRPLWLFLVELLFMVPRPAGCNLSQPNSRDFFISEKMSHLLTFVLVSSKRLGA